MNETLNQFFTILSNEWMIDQEFKLLQLLYHHLICTLVYRKSPLL